MYPFHYLSRKEDMHATLKDNISFCHQFCKQWCLFLCVTLFFGKGIAELYTTPNLFSMLHHNLFLMSKRDLNQGKICGDREVQEILNIIVSNICWYGSEYGSDI